MKAHRTRENPGTERNPLNELAEQHIGVPYLFPYQHLVVSNTLEAAGLFGEEAAARAPNRQTAILPTGSGKSLCYMLPAALLPGLTIIVFPLLSLIADQRRRAEEAGLPCESLVGGQTAEQRRRVWERLDEGELRMLLTNPEMLLSPGVIDRLQKNTHMGLSHLVFDEAHTISEWGDSFRPSYLEVGGIARTLAPLVITAFTATASERILRRIEEVLFGGAHAALVRANPDRPNITYSVVPSISKTYDLARLISPHSENPVPRPALVFCRSRRGAELTAADLQRSMRELPVRFYHAGLEKEEKRDIENWFFESNDGVLCSTTAYGMGVDKKNIRSVIHREPSPSVEAYLQESGRAGRDGKPSHAVILLSPEDQSHGKSMDRPEERGRYGELLTAIGDPSRCRRAALLGMLDAELEHCFGCDVCASLLQWTACGEREILRFFSRRPYRFDMKRAAQILSGRLTGRGVTNGFLSEKHFGVLAQWRVEEIEEAISSLLESGRLKKIRRGPWKGCVGPGAIAVAASAVFPRLNPRLRRTRER